MDFLILGEITPALGYVIVGVISVCVGSFLNVVIHRLPVMMERAWRDECQELFGEASRDDDERQETGSRFNLAVPRSSCPHCGHQISALENIPVLSYLVLRGRCRGCNEPISLRYPFVELLTMFLSLVVFWRFGWGWQLASLLPLTWALVALSLIDYDHQLLPDSIVLPLLWLGMVVSLFSWSIEPAEAILGAAFGYMSLWMIFQLFKLATGKEGMGYGDFKLLALFGAWGGAANLIQIILLSSVVGAFLGGALMLFAGRDGGKPMPFGPFIAIAGWVSLLWGAQINEAYLRFSGL